MVTKQQFVIISLIWRSIRLAVLIIASLSLIACSKDSGGLSENKLAQISLVPIDTVDIAIDSMTSNVSPLFNYIECDGKRFLLLLNSALRRLQCYDLDKLNESFVIELESEGPSSIPDIGGFLFHRPDSIFLFSIDYENTIFLIDTSGKVKDSYIINNALERENYFYEISVEEFFQPTFNYRNSILTFWAAPSIPRYTKEFYQFPLVVDYNIKSRKIIRNYGYYPETYRQNGINYRNENIYRLSVDTLEIHYFANSHSLYLYDGISKEFQKTVFMKSKFTPNIIEPIMVAGEERPSLQKQKNHFITAARYCRLIHDNEHSLFYRIVRQSQELRGADNLLNGKIDSKLAIMVLTENFEYAGETELMGKSFMDDFSFVSNGTLWININHPANPINKENFLSFVLFKAVAK